MVLDNSGSLTYNHNDVLQRCCEKKKKMPLARIEILKGKSREYKKALPDASPKLPSAFRMWRPL